MRLKQKQLFIGLLGAVAFSTCTSSALTTQNMTYACTTVESCQQEIKSATEERQKLQTQITDTKSQKDALVAEVQNLQTQVATYNAQIEASQQTITLLDSQSKQLETNMKITEGILSERLVTMQLMYETNQNINFIADSSSITDMIERAQAVNELTESDQQLVKTYDGQHKQVIENKQQTEKTKSELEGYKANQEKLIQENSVKIEQFKKQQESLEKEDKTTVEEQKLSESQLKEIEAALAKIPETKVETQPVVQAASSGTTPTVATATVQQTNQGQQAQTNQGQQTQTSQGQQTQTSQTPTQVQPTQPTKPVPVQPTKPVPQPTPQQPVSRVYPLQHAVLTAAYAENQWHAIPHNGTDYGPRGDASVYSMVDGVVVANKYNSARGWLVAIAFRDGSGTKTLMYQHLAGASSAPIGATVAKGQRVGVAGNTGMSFGVHLHVEVGDAGPGGKWVDRGASAGPGLYATERYFGLPSSW